MGLTPVANQVMFWVTNVLESHCLRLRDSQSWWTGPCWSELFDVSMEVMKKSWKARVLYVDQSIHMIQNTSARGQTQKPMNILVSFGEWRPCIKSLMPDRKGSM